MMVLTMKARSEEEGTCPGVGVISWYHKPGRSLVATLDIASRLRLYFGALLSHKDVMTFHSEAASDTPRA